MKVAGVREFRNHAPEFLKGDDLVFVTRHGRLTGIVVPVEKPESLPVDLRRELLERIGEAVSTHLRKTGVTEKKVLRGFQTWRKKRTANRRGR